MTMRQHPNEGRNIHKIWWPDSGDGEVRGVTAHNGLQLVFHSENLGDHSENWVLEMSGGQEIRRHNTRYIESIIWIEY